MNLYIKLLFLFLIFINVTNSTLRLASIASSSQVNFNTFVFTPFFPIRKDTVLSLRLTSTVTTPTSYSGFLSLYSDTDILVFRQAATYTIDDGLIQPGTSSSSSSSGAATVIYNNNNNNQIYQHKNLKAAQIANYTTSISFPFQQLINPSTNSIFTSYYFVVNYIDEKSINQTDNYQSIPIVFNQPAYNSTLENSIISTNNIEEFDGFGQTTCKHSTIVQLETGKSKSYGLYYHQNIWTAIYEPIIFLKSKGSFDYYYYYNEYTSTQSATTLYDALTSQQRSIQTNLQCTLPNLYQTNAINNSLVGVEVANGFSSFYSVITSTNRIELVQLKLGLSSTTLQLKPITFFNANSNVWTHLLRITQYYSSVAVIISNPTYSNNIGTTAVTQVPMQVNCVYSPVSNVFYKDITGNSKYTYENRQVQILVECNYVGSSPDKVNSVDFESGGTIFFADREYIDITSYSRLITIPDKLITYGSTSNYLSVYLNYPSIGRSLIINQTIDLQFKEISQSVSNVQITNSIVTQKEINFYNPSITTFSTVNNFINPQYNLSLLNVGGFTTLPYFKGDGVTFPTSFPQCFTGYSNSLQWKPSLPIPSDTPASYIAIPGAPIDNNVNFVSNPYLIRDFVNPSVTAKFIFSTDPSIDDEIIVSVSDKMGTGSDNCRFSIANYNFLLVPGDSIKHIDQNNDINNVDYSFKLKFNKYYCGSTYPVIDCSDIRGNRIYESNFSTTSIRDLFFDGFNSCPIQSVPQARLLTNFVNFQSSANVAINMLLGDVESLESYNIIASIYGDYDNVGPVLSSQTLTKSNFNSDTHTMVATGSFSFAMDSTTLTSTKYISITVSYIASPLIKFTLSTRDLEYLDSKLQVLQTTTTVVHSKFKIRNQAYKGDSDLLKNLVLIKYGSGALNCRVTSVTGISNIYNFTVSIKDKYISTTQRIVISTLNSSTYTSKDLVSIDFNIPSYKYYYVNVFIDNICDQFNNCFDLSPFANTSTVIDFGITPGTTPTYSTTIGTPSFSKTYIDTSSANRKVRISVDLKINNTITNSANQPFELSYGSGINGDQSNLPIFYIGEKESGDQLKCPLIQSAVGSSVYICDLDVPLYWGVRYVGQCSIWNIIHPDGYLYGKIFPTCSIFFFKQYLPYPNVWEISVKMGDTQLMVSGTNLDLIPQNINSQDLSLFTSSNFTIVNNTMGYYQLKNEVNAPFTITIYNKPISVFIITCMKPDCSGHGTCSKTVCSCNQGWGGSDCSIDTTFKCLNNCNGKGTCSIDMVCNCNSGYTGVDCNTYSPDIGLSMGVNTSKTEPTINLGQFGTTNSSDLNEYTRQSNFSILIPYIQEIDFYGNLVTNYTFNSSSWFLVESNSTFTIYNTTLTEYSNFTITLETIETDTTRIWAGQTLSLPANSIKYSVKIQNYTFSSNLNTLQMVYQATPGGQTVLSKCQIEQQKIAWGAKVPTDMHWVTLPNNQVSLYGRFSNNMVADGRIISTSNEGLEFGTTIQVKVNIPFFRDYIELDPDFSVLVNNVDSTQYDECGIEIKNNESNRKWVLPVSVVVSVVGAAVIVTALMTLLYTKNANVRTRLLSFKSKMSRSRNNISMRNLN